MVRGTFIDRGVSERVTLADALDRYPIEVSPTKKPSTAASDQCRARVLEEYLGRYSLVALTPETVSRFCDDRLREGKSPPTVRLELALLSHLFTIAAAEATRTGQRVQVAKDRSGAVEAVRVLRTTRKTAIKCRRAALQQLHNTIVAAPEEVRDQVRNLTGMQRLRTCAAWRPDTVGCRPGHPARGP